MEFSAAIGEEFGEGVADLSFVVEVKLSDLVEGSVVALHCGVRRLEVYGHLWRLNLQRWSIEGGWDGGFLASLGMTLVFTCEDCRRD
jgi:hypothetical protein